MRFEQGRAVALVAGAGLALCLCAPHSAAAQVLEPLAVGQTPAPKPVRLGDATLETVPLDDIPLNLSFRDRKQVDRITVETRRGHGIYLRTCAAALCAEPAGEVSPPQMAQGQVPGTLLTEREGGPDQGLVAAWLAEPVARLGENEFGLTDAGTLMAREASGAVLTLELPLNQAFLDVRPRLADLDGDKLPEVVVVKAEVGRGATLVIIKHDSVGLRIISESASNAVPGSWLKPAGIADFDGDGTRDIAIVRDPGPAGRLELWSTAGGLLTPQLSLRGFNNHMPGVPVDAMSVTGDFDGDTVPDLVLPSGDRNSLRVISFRGGQVAEPARIALPASIATGILVAAGEGGRPILAFGQEDGAIAVLGRDVLPRVGAPDP